jgi:hypothetical protein
MAHHPGPWHLDQDAVRCEDDTRGGTFICIMDPSRPAEEIEANQRLIAQAPQMLSLLIAFSRVKAGNGQAVAVLQNFAKDILSKVDEGIFYEQCR